MSSKHATEPLQLVYSDLWGPAPVTAHDGARYLISFTDDCMRLRWVYGLKKKSAAFSAFKVWIVMVERITGKKLRIFRVDGGREYLNDAWKTFMRNHGIKWEITSAYTHEQNGVAERFWRTSISGVRVCLAQAKLPLSFWKLAVDYMVFTINRTTLAHLASDKQTGYQVLHNH